MSCAVGFSVHLLIVSCDSECGRKGSAAIAQFLERCIRERAYALGRSIVQNRAAAQNVGHKLMRETRRGPGQHHEALWIFDRKHPKHEGINGGENRCVGPDSQTETE